MIGIARRRHRRTDHRGQTLVEFALVIPIVILLFMGIFDMARLVYFFNAISDAARNGVREAIVNQSCSDVATSARSSAPGVDLSASSAIVLTVYRSPVVSATPTPDVCPGLGGGYGIGYLAEVRVETTFSAITPVIGQIVGPITMASTARLPIERTYP
jgi:Flp pilus assembly protein TadG